MIDRATALANLAALAALALVPAAALAADPDKVVLTDAQWKARLSPEAFDILRREGTEMPFSSPLDHEKRAGIYYCAGCNLALYSSKTKYDSGTGWPSFWKPLPQRGRDQGRQLAGRRAQRSALPALRGPSRARLRRRAAADRKALLHGRRRAEIRPGVRTIPV